MKILKQAVMIISILAITALSVPSLSFAEIPKAINYQGKLTDTSGSPVSDGTYSVTFRIYDVGAGGSPLWYEAQSITTQKGLFSTQIGATKDLSLAFDNPYYLGIQVGSDSEMTPRQSLTSSAYAFEAAHAAVATTLIDETKLIPSGAILIWSGSIATIPDSWVLCDGSNGTPDLRGRFILGAGNKAEVGSKNLARITGINNDLRIDSGSNEKASGGGTCTGQHINMIPDYYALCYIMKS